MSRTRRNLSPFAVSVRRSPIPGEYLVEVHRFGVSRIEETYFTTDKADAHQTAAFMAFR